MLTRVQDGYSSLDAAVIASNYAEDCVVESPVAGRHVGRPAVERGLRTIFAAFPDLNIHGDEPLIAGNRAVWTLSVSGTDNGGFMGIPPTGKPFSTWVIFLFTFGDDHKIVHERRVYDFSRLLLELSGEAEPATEGPQLYRALLERARDEHEMEIAAEIQRALLPQARREGATFQIAAKSTPCRAIGGDFFDYFDRSDGAFSFVIGDVAGKGASAALLASLLQGIFGVNAHRGDSPAVTLAEVNTSLVRRAIRARFATVVYAVLEADGRLTYCNAGHNPPVLVSARGVRRLQCGGLIVGAFDNAAFDEEMVRLEPGDVLVAFSDGITEARNGDGDEFGDDRLLSCVTTHSQLSPTALVDRLLDDVFRFSDGATQSDDLTALALRYSGPSHMEALALRVNA